MKILSAAQPIPVHIISGFLGAGKTTLLKHLLQQKPEQEIWAVLMNEFGQIGVDQQLLPQDSGYAVKELLGGCLCCSSQLPMQIALSRLLSEVKPDRLFIEPTGLGHPGQLLEQLTEPHWHSHLNMQALVTVVDGSRLHDRDWTQQNLYADQLKAAHIVVISHTDLMTAEDHAALMQLQAEYQVYAQQWLCTEQGQLSIEQIKQDYQGSVRQLQPLLKQQQINPSPEVPVLIQQLPYHYVESALRAGSCRNAGNFIFMICSTCCVNKKTGSESKEFLIPIRAGKALISIRSSLIISRSRQVLITGSK